MSGSRRIQRSVRVGVAAALVALTVAVVVAALLTSRGVGIAAAMSAVLGAVALRMAYAEVVETRRRSARDRAEQARAFGASLAVTHADHRAFTAHVTERLAADSTLIGVRDRTIAELTGTLRLADRRADEAIGRARAAEQRVEVEAARGDLAEARLSELLDEVLAPPSLSAMAEADDDADSMPTVVDLLAWEDRIPESRVEGSRREA